MHRLLRDDAAAVTFLAEQLLAMDPRVHRIVYADPQYQLFIPVNNQIPPGAEEVGFDVYDSVGIAAWYTGTGEDLPPVTVTKRRYTAPIKDFGVHSTYTDKQLENAAFEQQMRQARGMDPGATLPEEQDVAAGMAVAQFHERVSVSGDATLGILGLTNQPNINNFVIAAGATSGATLWTGKTDDEVLDDLNGAVEFAVNATKNMPSLAPNAMVLPLNRYTHIAGRRLKGDNGGKTILAWFIENNPFVKDVKPWAQLDGKGPSGGSFGMVYRRDPLVLEYRTGNQFERKPPERKALGWKVYTVANSGGVAVKIPVAITKFTGF